MRRGPQSSKIKTDYLARAREGWLEVPPEIEALAVEAQKTSGTAVAKRLGYSPALISQLISGRYPGDVDLAKARIRGALMGEQVECPVLGSIPRDRCINESLRPFAATNSIRARLFHACKICPLNARTGADHDGHSPSLYNR
jgi:hypothetical protein